MQNSPVNRLEGRWPRAMAPEAEQYADEESGLSGKAKSWEASLENFMADHPKLTVATAAAIGLALGWMVKRK